MVRILFFSVKFVLLFFAQKMAKKKLFFEAKKTKKKYAVKKIIQKTKIAPLCCEVTFLQKL